MKLNCYKQATCCSGIDCCFLGENPEQPCWGQVKVVDNEYDGDGGEIYIHCCEGHEGMTMGGEYIEKPV